MLTDAIRAHLDRSFHRSVAKLRLLSRKCAGFGPVTFVHQARRALNTLAEAIALMIIIHPRREKNLAAIRHRIKHARARLSAIRDQQAVRDLCQRQRIASKYLMRHVRFGQSAAAVRKAASACCTSALQAVRGLSLAPGLAEDSSAIQRHLLRSGRRIRKLAGHLSGSAPPEQRHQLRKKARNLILDLELIGMPTDHGKFIRRVAAMNKLIGRQRNLMLMKGVLDIGKPRGGDVERAISKMEKRTLGKILRQARKISKARVKLPQ